MSLLTNLWDRADMALSSMGIVRAARWEDLQGETSLHLYAGRLFRSEEQFDRFVGLSYNSASSRNISHDVRKPFPIPDNCVAIFQSQDVFEHVPAEEMPALIEEIYRVLEPGGLFRLSLPDYRFDGYRDRCQLDQNGNIVFDPGGGGRYLDGQIIDGGHLWFPVFETVEKMLAESSFGREGEITFLHYTRSDGTSVLKDIDHSLGRVKRTPDFDPRAATPRRALSIVVDCVKPGRK